MFAGLWGDRGQWVKEGLYCEFVPLPAQHSGEEGAWVGGFLFRRAEEDSEPCNLFKGVLTSTRWAIQGPIVRGVRPAATTLPCSDRNAGSEDGCVCVSQLHTARRVVALAAPHSMYGMQNQKVVKMTPPACHRPRQVA
jgi:hypothetical protein